MSSPQKQVYSGVSVSDLIGAGSSGEVVDEAAGPVSDVEVPGEEGDPIIVGVVFPGFVLHEPELSAVAWELLVAGLGGCFCPSPRTVLAVVEHGLSIHDSPGSGRRGRGPPLLLLEPDPTRVAKRLRHRKRIS